LEIKEYILKAAKGDQTAYTFLLDFYWNDVYNFILHRTQNEIEAEDITIETFSKAFDKLLLYNPEFKFNTWLFTIAKNIHLDLVRKKKVYGYFISRSNNQLEVNRIIDETPTIEDNIIKEQNLKILKSYIKKLKPHYQEVINLKYFQEMSYLEISNQLGEPLNNIKIKLFRAKKLLLEIINSPKKTN
jgi:RNA polymerase sigma-70 factor (ECF subfamily)